MKNKLVTEETILAKIKKMEQDTNDSIRAILGHDKVMVHYTFIYDTDMIEGRVIVNDRYDSDFFTVIRLDRFRNSFGGHQTKMYFYNEDEMFRTLDLDELSDYVARKFLADSTVSNVFAEMLAEKVEIFDEDNKILNEWNKTRLVKILTDPVFKNNIVELISSKVRAEVIDNSNLGKVVIVNYISGGVADIDVGMEIHNLYMKIIDILVPYIFLLAKEEYEEVAY